MDPNFLQQRLDDLRAKHGVPAMAVAVSGRDGEFVLVSGIRKAGEAEPVTASDKFHFGSNGKSVTAALIHQLVDEGLVKLSTTLAEALPDAAIAPAWQNVTVEQLLTHTSGLPANYPDMAALQSAADFLTPQQARKLVTEEILKEQSPQPASNEFSYSNIGYVLLGAIAEEKTGMAYEDLVQQRIFDKLGMASAGFGPPTGAQPSGHAHLPGGTVVPVEADNPPTYAPAGTMHASLSDWMKLAKSLMPRLPATGVPRNGGKNEYTNAALVKHGDIYSHDGSNTLNYARVMLLPKEGAIFIIAANDGIEHAQPAINALMEDILQQLKPSPPNPAPPPQNPRP